MNRRRYLQAIGGGATALTAGCQAVFGTGSDDRWQYRHQSPVADLAVGPDGVYVAGVPAETTTGLAGVGLAGGDERWHRDLTVSGSQLAMRWRAGHLLVQNGRTLIVTAASFTDRSWRRQGATPPVLADGTAYLRTVAAGTTWLEAIDLASGATTWRVDVSNGDRIPETQYPHARAGDVLAVTDRRFPLTGRSLTDGSVTWRTDHPTGSLVAATGDTFFVGMEGVQQATITAYDGATGERHTITETDAPTAVPAVVDDVLRVRVTGGATTTTIVYDADTRQRRWVAEGHRGPATWTTPTTVYAIDDTDRLVAFDAGDGTLRWRTSLPAFDRLPRIRMTDTNVVVDAGGTLQALAREDGHRRWRRRLPTEPRTRYPLAVGTDTVVYATERTVHAVDA
ncbi:MAG: PQQ-binding-like beta-propeller repeat protein [Halobacteriaceae archaeon]